MSGLGGRWLWLALVLPLAAASESAPASSPAPSRPASVARGPTGPGAADQPSRLRVDVLAAVPHDRTAFTEGLELHGGLLYEGTGLPGRSQLRIADPATALVRRRVSLPSGMFGEGIAVVGDRVWQLTWRDHTAFLRDRRSLAEIGRAHYDSEGWGLCHDSSRGRLVMGEGTDRLTFRDPVTFAALGSVRVTASGRPLRGLNELECAHGAVWANVWPTSQIVRIQPETGRVTATVDAGRLVPAGVGVLNGIAAVPGTDEFLVTGKLWPLMFRVRFTVD